MDLSEFFSRSDPRHPRPRGVKARPPDTVRRVVVGGVEITMSTRAKANKPAWCSVVLRSNGQYINGLYLSLCTIEEAHAEFETAKDLVQDAIRKIKEAQNE